MCKNRGMVPEISYSLRKSEKKNIEAGGRGSKRCVKNRGMVPEISYSLRKSEKKNIEAGGRGSKRCVKIVVWYLKSLTA